MICDFLFLLPVRSVRGDISPDLRGLVFEGWFLRIFSVGRAVQKNHRIFFGAIFA